MGSFFLMHSKCLAKLLARVVVGRKKTVYLSKNHVGLGNDFHKLTIITVNII